MTAPVRKLLSREERAASILAASAHAFAEGGFAATSMDDVATAAGVTKLILYRHFDSKADLYRAVLDEVAARVAEEFVRGFNAADPRGTSSRALLVAARENPEGFCLLWRHAPREPEFAAHAEEVRAAADKAAEGLIAEWISDPALRSWAARTLVGFLIEATLNWLEQGDPGRDEEFVVRTTEGLEALRAAWQDARGGLSAGSGAPPAARGGTAPGRGSRRPAAGGGRSETPSARGGGAGGPVRATGSQRRPAR
jgi:AcrR family transcriptional regulator